MAFKRFSSPDELPDNHDINVTPFIDVMLVLLIIFMVAAPLATVSVPVDLPSSSAEPTPKPDKPFYLTVQEDLTLVLGEDQPVALEQLSQALGVSLPDKEQRIFLRADQSLSYQNLMKVMNALSAAGYLQVALVGLEAAS
ncbi:TonB system transport protein ExbD [Oceanimonas baumannii]|uniref:Biopolymer transport protein ExbD n=1 Tax=Oceanimonas baumannii TaxID=129578 RepID=A0A235CFG7_9GAMM|nr:TonB system transport protein ExbD [Oceanimonas baumannii]MCC4264474.1 TonB system transport protein ExbD [Oceanimonas baumannii]OYD22767.1 TonB system transport protein ExbD [Oceanimonas baumannii]TDW57733.1 biopolymer transport protein ExbD [Oceanimonas baumannii]